MAGKLLALGEALSNGYQTITVNNIPQNYSHLEVVVIGNHTAGSTATGTPIMYFNNNTSNTYLSQYIVSTSTNVGNFISNSLSSSMYLGFSGGVGTTTRVWIPNYTSSKNKEIICSGGAITSNSWAYAGFLAGGNWRNTAAITRIDVAMDVYATIGRVYVFGWK